MLSNEAIMSHSQSNDVIQVSFVWTNDFNLSQDGLHYFCG